MEYLYHYTNIESLALILKNRTIRFNSLNKMDDLQEAKTAHTQNFGQYCFVSSWAEDEKEEIPMWRMYTQKDSGFRIKLRKNPFEMLENTPESFNIKSQDHKTSEQKYIKSLISFATMIAGGYFCPTNNGDILHKVQYTDDTDLLYPSLLSTDGKGLFIETGKMGKYKNTYWKFQHEWRYILLFVPINLVNEKGVRGQEALMETITQMINDTATLPFSNYDLHIDRKAFEDMIITLSPNISKGNEILIRSIAKEYNPKVKFENSSLKELLY